MALDTPLAIEFDYRWQPQSAEDAPPKVGQLAQVPFGRRQVTGLITESGLSPMQTMWMLIGLYLILGMFMESLSMMIATVPIITPVVIAMGFDPVWFGILMMVLLETVLITPPVGLNLFIVQGGAAARPDPRRDDRLAAVRRRHAGDGGRPGAVPRPCPVAATHRGAVTGDKSMSRPITLFENMRAVPYVPFYLAAERGDWARAGAEVRI